MIGGSNLLEPRRLKRRQQARQPWHWGVCTDVDSIASLRPPLMLLGMGSGSDWGQPILPYSARAKEEIRLLHHKAFASAVRDQTTLQALAAIGVRTQCTGCPVTFLTPRPIAPTSGTPPLIVSLPPARILKRWSGRLFMRQTMAYIRWLQLRNVPFVVTLHERADLEFAPHWLPRGLVPFYTENVTELIGRYEDCCGVIGYRLHAALLGIGLGKPIVPVSVDWRGRAFVHTFQLQDVALEPFAWSSGARLRLGTLAILQRDPAWYRRLDEQKQHWRQKFEAVLRRAAENFRGTQQAQVPRAA